MNDPKDKKTEPSDEQTPGDGFSFLDMLDLSPQMHSVIRLLLPTSSMSYVELCEALLALPGPDRLSQSEIDATLVQMTSRGLIAKEVIHGQVFYKVVMGRRKARTNTLDKEIWDSLGWGDEP